MSENECTGTFRGVVFTGRGEGSFYMSIYAKNFRTKLGFTPYPGTLNIKLIDNIELYNNCVKMLPKIVIDPPKIEGARLARVIAYRVYINGVPAYAVRPEITVYKSDVVEIISDKHLRSLLGLKDGDVVHLSVARKGSE